MENDELKERNDFIQEKYESLLEKIGGEDGEEDN